MTEPTFDFSPLEVQADKTAEYTFWGLKDRPVLICRPATAENSDFWRAYLKANARMAGRAASGHLRPEDLEQTRERDRRLYSKFVIRGWRNVLDAKTREPVPFAREYCEAFVRALPRDYFDDLRAWCADLDNFRQDEDDDLAEDEIEDVAGN